MRFITLLGGAAAERGHYLVRVSGSSPTYDCGDFPKIFGRALADYDGFAQRRAAGNREDCQGRPQDGAVRGNLEARGEVPHVATRKDAQRRAEASTLFLDINHANRSAKLAKNTT